MKEATGELNMTVITVVIIAALAAVGGAVILPAISGGMRNSSCEAMLGDGAKAIKQGSGDSTVWWCCPSGTTAAVAGTCQELSK